MHYNDTVLRRPNRLLESEKHHAYHRLTGSLSLTPPVLSTNTRIGCCSRESAISRQLLIQSISKGKTYSVYRPRYTGTRNTRHYSKFQSQSDESLDSKYD